MQVINNQAKDGVQVGTAFVMPQPETFDLVGLSLEETVLITLLLGRRAGRWTHCNYDSYYKLQEALNIPNEAFGEPTIIGKYEDTATLLVTSDTIDKLIAKRT